MRGVDAPELRRLVQDARVARLATIAADGRPRLVPCTFALATTPDGGDVLYSAVDDKPKASRDLARLRDVERDPRVTVLVDHYDDDWSELWWVRLRGTGRVLRDGPERDTALDLLAVRYAPYSRRRPDGAVLAIDVEDWRGWRAAGQDPPSR